MIQDLTADNFSDHIGGTEQPVVVKVWTSSCSNCKTLGPIFEAASKKLDNEAHFLQLDGETQLELARKYKVMAVPTLLFFRDGILVGKKAGVMKQTRIEEKLREIASWSSQLVKDKEVRGLWSHLFGV